VIELIFEWPDVDPGEERTGYDLGHMTFVGEKGICTSRGRSPDQSMMLTLSAGILLYGLRNFSEKKHSEYRFIGVGSSFSVYFMRMKGGRVDVWCGGGGSIARVGMEELLGSVLVGVEAFAARVESELPLDDLGRRDLFFNLEKYRRFLLK
jgi:hypothetical protein